jgi:hypothetical protein
MSEKKSKVNPRIAFAIAVFSGVIVGTLIKKMAFGLLIGILIAMIYVLGAGASRRK